MIRRIARSLLIAASLAAAAVASAQPAAATFPNKPIHIVVTLALFVPAGTPRPIIDKLQAEVKRTLELPGIGKRLTEIGLDPVGSSPEELGAYQAAEMVKWAKVVKDSGAKAE